jgi:hypothetical protein
VAAVAAAAAGGSGGGGIDSSKVGGRGSTCGDVGSSGRGGGGSGSGPGGGGSGSSRGGGGGGDSKRRMMRPSFPFSSLEALAKKSIQMKEKAEKVYFYLRQQLSRNTNLDPIFSESRSGTIANKNIKRITAATQLKTSSG